MNPVKPFTLLLLSVLFFVSCQTKEENTLRQNAKNNLAEIQYLASITGKWISLYNYEEPFSTLYKTDEKQQERIEIRKGISEYFNQYGFRTKKW